MNEAVSTKSIVSDTSSVLQKRQWGVNTVPLRIRLQILGCIALLLLIVFLHLLKTNRDFMYLLGNWVKKQPPSTQAVTDINDPSLNVVFPEIFHLVQLVLPKSAGKQFLLIPVGDCASCMTMDLRQWSQQAKSFGIEIVLLTTVDSKTSQEFLQKRKLSLPVVRDPQGQIYRRLNVVWAGRPYLFTSEGQLLWYSRLQQMHYNPFNDDSFKTALQSKTH